MVETEEFPEKHGVIFALFDGEKIFLEKRIERSDRLFGYTIVPGGGLEKGETVEEALIREVVEEFGVRPIKYIKLGDVFNSDIGVLNVGHVYIVTEWKGEIDNPEGRNEHLTETLAEARNLCAHPVTQRIVDWACDFIETEPLED